MFKPRHPFLPPTKAVMSCQWPLLERVTATWIMLSWPKNHRQSRTIRRTLSYISVNWSKCTRSQRASSSNSHNQRLFSPELTSSKSQTLTILRLTCQKTTRTMAQRRWSTPSNIRGTQPWNISTNIGSLRLSESPSGPNWAKWGGRRRKPLVGSVGQVPGLQGVNERQTDTGVAASP